MCLQLVLVCVWISELDQNAKIGSLQLEFDFGYGKLRDMTLFKLRVKLCSFPVVA